MDNSNCFACVYSRKKAPYSDSVECRYCPFEWSDYETEDEAFKCCYSYYGKLNDDICCEIDWKKCCKLAYKIAMLEVKAW